MELTKQDMKITKGVAILFMLLLHLFCRKEVNGLYETFPIVNGVPLVYYIGLFGDACVPMFCFASGYGLYVSLNKEKGSIFRKNIKRIFKFLINYWIVLILFVLIGTLAGKSDILPGNPVQFLLNFFVISNSYNGAWWFVQTYIILVLLAPYIFKFFKKYSLITLLLVSGFFYLVAYVQRIKHVMDFGGSTPLNMVVNAIVLVGTSQLPFIVGAIFAKVNIYSKIQKKLGQLAFKNLVSILAILLLITIHSFYESMIIAPITGILFICIFNLMNKSTWLLRLFGFIGNHSTNLWLTHMFFYMTIFPKLTFAPKYPIFIFCWLIILCLITSYIINLVYMPILKIIDKKKVHQHTNSDDNLILYRE
ncbi:acyltransferase family protein [Neobacillus cucumis]|uniref:acyltransferase family protein n=1 Tax=Neobacillus cucumis TaxID=1740721 RepID=UPI001963B0F4|nr:acyltransferase [Neobacillus cucumis]MBM7651845.1 surface polysaccharide O-acyltransferase-like enzyme [Neobacillus cucumis]